MALSGKLTKKLVENLGPGRHGDGNGLYLVVDPSGARRWIVRVTVKGQKNRKGAPLRTDFGLGGADVVTLNKARDRALEYRRMAKQGLNPRFNARQDMPTFEEFAQQVHIDRMPTWKNAKHGQQWINTLRDYAFPKIGRMPVDSIGQPEVLMCLSPIWTAKHETARRLAQRIKVVLDVAKSKGFREGENPVTAVKDASVLPKVKAKPKHHKAMHWRDVPGFYAEPQDQERYGGQGPHVHLSDEEKQSVPGGVGICPPKYWPKNDRIIQAWQTYAAKYSEKTMDRHLSAIRFLEVRLDGKRFDQLSPADVGLVREHLK